MRTANVFCAVEPKAGRHFTFPTPDRLGFEFAHVAAELVFQYPNAKTIHLIMDNLSSHTCESLTNLFGVEVGKHETLKATGPIFAYRKASSPFTSAIELHCGQLETGLNRFNISSLGRLQWPLKLGWSLVVTYRIVEAVDL